MWKTFLFLVIVLAVALFIVSWFSDKSPKPRLQAPAEPHVLLIVADSLMPEPLHTLMAEGQLPGFSFLREQGFSLELTSVFPTMSVVNDSSLLTGTYPDEHGVPGLVWFKRDEDRFVDYGDAAGNIFRQGLLKVAKDGLFHLNEHHLSPHVETVHEFLAKKHIPSASINLMVRRGPFKHHMRFPFDRIFGHTEVSGPRELRNGYFLKEGSRHFPTPLNKYGYGNDEVEKMTLDLMRQEDAPRLLITYLSEPDKIIHQRGPDVKKPLYEVDHFIQHILDAFPSWEEALKNWRIIVMGDSGQTPVHHDKEQALISISELLPQYALRGLSETPPEADFAVAANERMTYLYPLKDELDLAQLADRVLNDPRIDLVAYLRNDRIQVHTHEGSLQFHKGGTRMDPYGQKWEVTGDPGLLDVRESVNGGWEYGKYRDAFRQLYGALNAQSSVVVVSAQPGYEFAFESSPTHVGGGSHGGISLQEMTMSLVVGGTKRQPRFDRLVDMKQYIIDCLELTDES